MTTFSSTHCDDCGEGHDQCPSCERLTEDHYGGPCAACWAEVDHASHS